MPRTLVPWGIFGAGNVGDDAVLIAFASLVAAKTSKTPWVASRDVRHTQLVEPRLHYFPWDQTGFQRKMRFHSASSAVIVGDTPIMDYLGEWPLREICNLLTELPNGRPIAFMGTGTEDLISDSSISRVHELIPQVSYWTLRSERDRQRLRRLGVRGEDMSVAADLAWLLQAEAQTFGRRVLLEVGVGPNDRLLGINITNESWVRQQSQNLYATLAHALDELSEEGWKIVFLNNEVRLGEEFDHAAAIRILSLMKHAEAPVLFPGRYWTPREMLSLIGCCRVVVSMRYHSCLFSAIQGVPFVSLLRLGKLRDLCADLEWHHAVPLAPLASAQLVQEINQLEETHDSCSNHLINAAATQRSLAKGNSKALDRVLK